MRSQSILATAAVCLAFLPAGTAPAEVPAPPVNQTIGMLDVLTGSMNQSDCRNCHDGGNSDRHHLLYGQPIPPGAPVPYPDADRNGQPDTTYNCINCHGKYFTVVTNCIVVPHVECPSHDAGGKERRLCLVSWGHRRQHRRRPLHTNLCAIADHTVAQRRRRSATQSLRQWRGACNYCHDVDDPIAPFIQNNADLHHDASMNCLWCHSAHGPTTVAIRVCQNCHGPDSLHSIQADSPAQGNIGTIVVGGEYAGYGHVGRDAGPGDSDCWGCHGFARKAAPRSASAVPAIYDSDLAVITAGTDTTLMLAGAAFTNSVGNTRYESDVALTAADGSSVVLTPDLILDEGLLAVTIPKTTRAGNYSIQAVQDESASNPTVVTVVPKVRIKRAAGSETVTIIGSGFAGYARGSGTTVTGRITTVEGTRVRTTVLTGTIVSWVDGKIVARFVAAPNHVTVKSVFGTATSAVARIQ